MPKEIEFENSKVVRKFTEEWATSGLFNLEKVPDLVKTLVEQRKSMIEYIQALHDKIDFIMQRNHICDIPGCMTANCESDHK